MWIYVHTMRNYVHTMWNFVHTMWSGRGGIAVIFTIGNWPIVLRQSSNFALLWGEPFVALIKRQECLKRNCMDQPESGTFVMFTKFMLDT